ncbi:MAG TPA: carbohydrate kinase, partial [Bacillota bacterium]|nr:carbohydrate kinase [Bacillota bacterium]
NVARNLARLGTRVAFLGAVGGDPFGVFLRDVLAADGVDTSALLTVADVPTTLAFVHLEQGGERTFSFVRSPGADTCLRAADVPRALVAGADVLHAGSLSLTHPASSGALHHALDIAESSGVTISFDVNLRPLLWDDLSRARGEIVSVLKRSNLAKISEDELHFVLPDTAHLSVLQGARVMMQAFPSIRLLAITMGAYGSLVMARSSSGSLAEIRVPGICVAVVDTTGAGDTYCAALLHMVLRAGGLDEIIASQAALCNAANFSGKLASESVTSRGAVTISGR